MQLVLKEYFSTKKNTIEPAMLGLSQVDLSNCSIKELILLEEKYRACYSELYFLFVIGKNDLSWKANSIHLF